jgi:hypothetical protein
MNEGIYYLRLNGKVEGPYSIGQIYDLWAARKINSQTPFARFEEMEKWQPLSELTLKISAPKPLAARGPSVELPASASVKPRAAPPAETDDYVPPAFYPQREQRPSVTDDVHQTLRRLPRGIVFNLSICIGICVVCGAILAGYSALSSPASPDGKEIRQDLLILKQNGVIAGIGLILMGGLLLLARQVTQILIAIKAGALTKNERRPSQPT